MTRTQAAILDLAGITPHQVDIEMLQRAIKRVDAAIQTDECALVNLCAKIHTVEARLDWMRNRQIARQKELARQLTLRTAKASQSLL